MKRLFKSLIIKIKLAYYTLLDRLDTQDSIDFSVGELRVRYTENSKLARGVKKLVRRLRAMKPSERTLHENLLCMEPYQKTAQEKLEELRVLDKLNREPLAKTEDDLVRVVVKKAPIYAKEQELKELRKALTAVLKRSSADPKDTQAVTEAKAIKAKMELIRREIEGLKNG